MDVERKCLLMKIWGWGWQSVGSQLPVYKVQAVSILFKILSTSVYAAAKLLQSCPTLCDPTDGSPSGSSVPGILQARTREWVAISFSNA